MTTAPHAGDAQADDTQADDAQADGEASIEGVLARIAAGHPRAIEPGLDRLRAVAVRAGLSRVDVPLAIVAGTNGKGSTVVCLESIWRAAGRRTGAFLSPHLIRFNERIRIDGVDADDALILAALARIEPHIAPDSLTYFEAAALAAMACFEQAGVDAIVLEVGLGGRLDATNLWDANGAILTSVALDHADWLGTDLGYIATEKAAVSRRGGVLVVGEPQPPSTLEPWARKNGVSLLSIDAALADLDALPHFSGEHHRRNAACAVTLAHALGALVPLTDAQVRRGLAGAHLAGRLQSQQVDGVPVIVDVAHNPAAAQALAATLAPGNDRDRLHVVFAALGDKDIAGIARALLPLAASVACASLDSPRAVPAEMLVDLFTDEAGTPDGAGQTGQRPIDAHDSVESAWQAAATRARVDLRRVLVVGSHVTVGEWLCAHAGQPCDGPLAELP